MKQLREIAHEAQVSPSAVSLVLNNRPGVSDGKRTEIAQLLAENGYTIRHREAKNIGRKKGVRFLKYSKHGMLVNGNPGFVTAITDAVANECRKQGYDLAILAFDDKHLLQTLDFIRENPLDGIILLGTELDVVDLEPFDALGVPYVIVDNNMPYSDHNTVTMNNREAIFGTMRYLSALGHTKIGFVANQNPSNNCRERLAAYREAVSEAGLPQDESLIYYVRPTMQGAYDSMEALLRGSVQLPSALVANNDSIALGVMKAMRESGLRIPEDVSIIGFDGLPFSEVSDPPLTTVGVSCKSMGIWAVRLLRDYMASADVPAAKILIGTNLIERSSARQYCGECALSPMASTS